MDAAIDAFRRAHRLDKVPSVESAFGGFWLLDKITLSEMKGTWEEQLLCQALLILRKRGVPDRNRSADSCFSVMVAVLNSCQEKQDDDPERETRAKPPA